MTSNEKPAKKPKAIASSGNASSNGKPELSISQQTKLRRRRARNRARAAESAVIPNSSNSSQRDERPIIESTHDIGMLNQIRRKHPDWVPSDGAAKQVPLDMLALANKYESIKPETTLNALNSYARLMRDNWQKEKSSAQLEQRNYFLTRHQLAESPQIDEESPVETDTVDAVAFREQTSSEECIEVVEELKAMGLIHVFLGVEQEPDGKINES